MTQAMLIQQDKAQNELLLLTIDDGIIPKTLQNQKMCDYAFYDEKNKRSNFVELKGVDIKHACDQIYDTISYFEKDEDLMGVVEGICLAKGYIVSPCAHVPYIPDAHMKKLCKKLYYKSKDKYDNFLHHLVFVSCVPKNPGKAIKQDATHITISYNNPLLL
jgi:hypothetical protein